MNFNFDEGKGGIKFNLGILTYEEMFDGMKENLALAFQILEYIILRRSLSVTLKE